MNLHIRVPSLACLNLGAALIVAAACTKADNHARQMEGRCGAGSSDSARAANLALDTVRKLSPFSSQVFRFSRDSAGFRIVTIPAPGQHVTDGMAIVRLTLECRIASLVQTDSA